MANLIEEFIPFSSHSSVIHVSHTESLSQNIGEQTEIWRHW